MGGVKRFYTAGGMSLMSEKCLEFFICVYLWFDGDLWFCKDGLEGRLRHFLHGERDARAPRAPCYWLYSLLV